MQDILKFVSQSVPFQLPQYCQLAKDGGHSSEVIIKSSLLMTKALLVIRIVNETAIHIRIKEK